MKKYRIDLQPAPYQSIDLIMAGQSYTLVIQWHSQLSLYTCDLLLNGVALMRCKGLTIDTDLLQQLQLEIGQLYLRAKDNASLNDAVPTLQNLGVTNELIYAI
jgi:hypothetical protein